MGPTWPRPQETFGSNNLPAVQSLYSAFLFRCLCGENSGGRWEKRSSERWYTVRGKVRNKSSKQYAEYKAGEYVNSHLSWRAVVCLLSATAPLVVAGSKNPARDALNPAPGAGSAQRPVSPAAREG